MTKVLWPNGRSSDVDPGGEWLNEAKKVDILIPTGCLNGSCGACEIEVNGKVIRACISKIDNKSKSVKVNFSYDPYW